MVFWTKYQNFRTPWDIMWTRTNAKVAGVLICGSLMANLLDFVPNAIRKNLLPSGKT